MEKVTIIYIHIYIRAVFKMRVTVRFIRFSFSRVSELSVFKGYMMAYMIYQFIMLYIHVSLLPSIWYRIMIDLTAQCRYISIVLITINSKKYDFLSSFTLYPACSMVSTENLLLKHFALHSPPNSGGIACWWNSMLHFASTPERRN